MSPPPQSDIWNYFELNEEDQDKADCKICNKTYSRKGRTTTSLKNHLKSMHKEEYSFYECSINEKHLQKIKTDTETREAEDRSDDGQQNVMYLVEETPPSPVTKDTDVGSRHSRSSFFKRKLQGSRYSEGFKERSLIQQLTKEKIALTEVQKELVEKELEEKTIKVMVLQEDLEHRKHMQVLEKEEMQLKIDLLKAKLAKESITPPTDGSNIVLMPME